MTMGADISKRVVLILLVLVVVVSAMGTWAFLSSFEPRAMPGSTSSSGDVHLKIVTDSSAESSSGDVQLKIVSRETSQ